jgi:hypothetical protein
MNAYQKAQALGLTGTDAEIVDQLKSIKVTPSKVGIPDLKFLMRERGMLVKLTYEDPQTGMKWNGTVPNMIVALKAMDHPALGEVNKWFSHLTDPDSDYFDTTNPYIAGEFNALAQAFGGQPTMPSVEDFDAVIGLGGGWIYGSLTEAAYTAMRVAAEDAAAKVALEGVADTYYLNFVQKYNTVKQQIQNGTLVTEGDVIAAMEA